MTRTHHRLTGQIRLAPKPDEAFHLFTPRGEQAWADGWQPQFPASVSDDTVPGTVFQTDAHGHTATWVVTESTPGRSIRYARVIPQVDAGTVTVTFDPASGGTCATVSYELTALSPAGDERLRDFAAKYQVFLQSWEHAIVARPGTEPGMSRRPGSRAALAPRATR
jgi:Polyketide cyclase / dehydrase and lipid transport